MAEEIKQEVKSTAKPNDGFVPIPTGEDAARSNAAPRG